MDMKILRVTRLRMTDGDILTFHVEFERQSHSFDIVFYDGGSASAEAGLPLAIARFDFPERLIALGRQAIEGTLPALPMVMQQN